MGKKLTLEDARKIFEQFGHELLETEYINAKTQMEYRCQCGSIAFSTLGSMKNGHTCKKCASKRGANKNRIIFKDVYDYFLLQGCLLLETEYINNHTLMRYICECGNESVITFGSFQQGHRCNKCAIEKRKESQRFLYEYVFSYFDQYRYKLLELEYKNDATKMKCECPEGHIWYTTFNNFRQGYRCGKCADINNSGVNNFKWNPNLTDEQRKENESRQSDPKVREWRKRIFKRDNYTCQVCGLKQSNILRAHHLDGWEWCVEKRLGIDNATTCCIDCHNEFHNKFGYGGNTKAQFYEFLLFKNNQINIKQEAG